MGGMIKAIRGNYVRGSFISYLIFNEVYLMTFFLP